MSELGAVLCVDLPCIANLGYSPVNPCQAQALGSLQAKPKQSQLQSQKVRKTGCVHKTRVHHFRVDVNLP